MTDIINFDVFKLIADLYYTPIITSFEEEHRFYCVFTYPSHKLQLRIPPCNYRYGKSMCTIYLYEEIEVFIECLNENIKGKIHMTAYFDLQIVLNKEYIHIIQGDEINKNLNIIDFKIVNTENSRKQLADALYSYIEYMIFYDPEHYLY